MKGMESRYWLALLSIAGIGPQYLRKLVCHFGSPRAVFEASLGEIHDALIISASVAQRIRNFKDWSQMDRQADQMREDGVELVCWLDDSYPPMLRHIYGFPPVLFTKGRLFNHNRAVAVVGSRSASRYGSFITERLCRDLARYGIVIVSGMARGIDTSAHRGSLAAGGMTVAVLGSGIDVIYPPENKALSLEISGHGAVVSEFLPGTPPKAQNFPLRNRIISGMALGVIVVEATEKSGSLITARMALEQGREVFAVPGGIDAPGSRGTNKLIREGAQLVTSADDIIETLEVQFEGTADSSDSTHFENAVTPLPIPLNDGERELIRHMGSDPVDVDELVVLTGFEASHCLSALLSLELKGQVQQLPGKRFVRKE